MKKPIKYLFFLFISAAVLIPALDAQEKRLRGTSLNGSTGLYSIPSGRIGWERDSDLGLDLSYHAIINEDGAAHIPAITLSLFKWLEFSTAFDIQPDILEDVRYWDGKRFYWETPNNDDLLLGVKIQLPTNVKNTNNPAIALGTNIQIINVSDDDEDTSPELDFTYTAFQFYGAATYAGTFFTMPAETTLVIGKTIYSGIDNNSDIDFGMGFDLILLPDVFQRYVHWIIDFANFDYSDNSWPNKLLYGFGPPWYRGILNTGLRFDLGAIPALSKFKFTVDVIFNDLFDNVNRSFTIGGAFGISIL